MRGAQDVTGTFVNTSGERALRRLKREDLLKADGETKRGHRRQWREKSVRRNPALGKAFV